MTDIATLLNSRWLAALGLGMMHSLWQAAVIAAAAAVILREIRGGGRYVVAYGALMLIPVACALTVWRITAGVPSPLAVPFFGWEAAASWLGCAWIAGVGTASLRLATGWVRLQRLRASVIAAPESWQSAVDAICRRFGIARAVRLVETQLTDVPGIIGWTSPLLLFPAGLLAGLPPAQVQLILAHELAHVRRNDYLWNLVQTAVETAFFFHPAVWWLARRVRAERERCCDDLVIAEFSDRQQYAEALMGLERYRSGGNFVLAPAATGGDLLGRIRRVIEDPRCDSKRASPLLVVAAVAITLTALAMLGIQAGSTASVAALQSSVWLAAVLGLLVGVRHAFEPDHLVAISTLVTGERRAIHGAHLGVSWGLGHTLTLFLVAGTLALVRMNMPGVAAAALEAIVGLMLIALGARAVRAAVDLATKGPDVSHAHGGVTHRHPTSAAHVHLGGLVLARRPFVVGMVHGLAGSGALAALAMTTIPTIPVQVVFIVFFGLGSTLGMAALSGMAGFPLARLAQRPVGLACASAAVGVASVAAGLIWAAPILLR